MRLFFTALACLLSVSLSAQLDSFLNFDLLSKCIDLENKFSIIDYSDNNDSIERYEIRENSTNSTELFFNFNPSSGKTYVWSSGIQVFGVEFDSLNYIVKFDSLISSYHLNEDQFMFDPELDMPDMSSIVDQDGYLHVSSKQENLRGSYKWGWHDPNSYEFIETDSIAFYENHFEIDTNIFLAFIDIFTPYQNKIAIYWDPNEFPDLNSSIDFKHDNLPSGYNENKYAYNGFIYSFLSSPFYSFSGLSNGSGIYAITKDIHDAKYCGYIDNWKYNGYGILLLSNYFTIDGIWRDGKIIQGQSELVEDDGSLVFRMTGNFSTDWDKKGIGFNDTHLRQILGTMQDVLDYGHLHLNEGVITYGNYSSMEPTPGILIGSSFSNNLYSTKIINSSN